MADLDGASIDDVKAFFRTYYAPNNAAVVVSGDIDPVQTLAWIKKYFGPIKAAALPPRPDISEPRQTQEKREVKEYLEAPRPAIAVAYHTPRYRSPASHSSSRGCSPTTAGHWSPTRMPARRRIPLVEI